MQPELVSEKNLPVAGGAKEIEIQNICFGYGRAGEGKAQILNDISFAIQPGKKLLSQATMEQEKLR